MLLLDLPRIVMYVLAFVLALIIVGVFFGFFGEFFIPLLLTAAVAVLLSQYAKAGQVVSPVTAVAVLLATFGFGYFLQRLALVPVALTRAQVEQLPAQQAALLWLLLALVLVAIAALATKAVCGRVFCARGAVHPLASVALLALVIFSVFAASALATIGLARWLGELSLPLAALAIPALLAALAVYALRCKLLPPCRGG